MLSLICGIWKNRGAWLAQLVEHATLDLGVVSWSLMLGVQLKKKIFKKNFFRLYHFFKTSVLRKAA